MSFSTLAAVSALPLLLAAGMMTARQPVWLLAVYAAVVPFGSSISVLGIPGPFGTLSTLLGLSVALMLLIHLGMGREQVLQLPAPLPLWSLVAVIAVITLAWSIDRPATIEGLLVLLSLVALYVVASLIQVRPEGVRLIGTALVLSGAGVGSFAVYQLITGTLFTDPGTGTGRFALAGGGGETGDPNITAAGLLLPLVIAVFRAVEPHRIGRIRVANALAAVLMTAAVLLTGSRGGLLALVAIGAVLLLNDPARRLRLRHVIAVVSVLAVMFAFAPPELQDRLLGLSSTGRMDIWLIGLASCPDYCLSGSGWGTYSAVHAEGLLVTPERTGWAFGYGAHNVWIQVLVETGIAGMVLFLTAIVVTFRQLSRLPTTWRGVPIAALSALLASNVFLGNLDFKYFWLTLLYVNLSLTAAEHLPETGRLRPAAATIQTTSRGVR